MHLAGDFEKPILSNYYLIYHGPPTQAHCGAEGAVAIILSVELAIQWNQVEKPKNHKRRNIDR